MTTFDSKALREAAEKAINTRACLLESNYTQGSVAETMDAYRAYRDLLTPAVTIALLDRMEKMERAVRECDRLLADHVARDARGVLLPTIRAALDEVSR